MRVINIKYFPLLLFLVMSNNAFACSCSIWSNDRNELIRHAFKMTPTIVLAKVISINKPGLKELAISEKRGYRPETTNFKTITIFKGALSGKFKTTMLVGSGMCGLKFIVGETYLLYLSKSIYDETAYATTICSPNQTLLDAEEDIRMIKNISLLKK